MKRALRTKTTDQTYTYLMSTIYSEETICVCLLSLEIKSSVCYKRDCVFCISLQTKLAKAVLPDWNFLVMVGKIESKNRTYGLTWVESI